MGYYIKKIKKIIKDSQYREYYFVHRKYNGFPRHVMQKIELGGVVWEVPDVASFLSQWGSLVINKEYAFETMNANPVVLDFGGNIGVSVYVFLNMYPTATIHVYEPDPEIFKTLEKNVNQFSNGNVYLHNMAVWDGDESSVLFYPDKADGGRCVDRENENDTTVEVQTIDVIEIMNMFDHLDFLKIDILLPKDPAIHRIQVSLLR